jgi:hypothetical protein
MKILLDYLKFIWIAFFIFSYTYTYFNYTSLVSNSGPYIFAGFGNGFFLGQLIHLRIIYCAFILVIASMIAKQEPKRFK